MVQIDRSKIVKEIALADFMSKPISQFLDKQTAGTVNEQPVYNVRVSNPRSLDLIEFKSLNESAVGALKESWSVHARWFAANTVTPTTLRPVLCAATVALRYLNPSGTQGSSC